MAEQIHTQVVALVGSGGLPAGARLPPVRTLASDLGVAPNTVAKAYRALEQDGFVTTAGRRGTVVTDQHPEVSAALRRSIGAALQPLLDQGSSTADVLRVVRSVLDERR